MRKYKCRPIHVQRQVVFIQLFIYNILSELTFYDKKCSMTKSNIRLL